MRFVSVCDFRSKSAQIWKDLPREQEMVVTLNGKPVALLTPVTEATVGEDIANLRKMRALAALRAVQLRSVQNGTDRLSLEEINAEIDAWRKSVSA